MLPGSSGGAASDKMGVCGALVRISLSACVCFAGVAGSATGTALGIGESALFIGALEGGSEPGNRTGLFHAPSQECQAGVDSSGRLTIGRRWCREFLEKFVRGGQA